MCIISYIYIAFILDKNYMLLLNYYNLSGRLHNSFNCFKFVEKLKYIVKYVIQMFQKDHVSFKYTIKSVIYSPIH